jgi:protoporphyrinogen oxidase
MLLLRRSLSPIYWMNISDPTVPFGGLIEHTNFIPPARYQDRRIVYVSHYVYADEPIYRSDSRQLFEHYRPGVRRVQPAFDDDWIERQLTFRDDYAQPIVDVGYHRRLLPLESPLAGLVVATMSQIYPEDRGTNYAVRIGERAAQTLLAGALARARGS